MSRRAAPKANTEALPREGFSMSLVRTRNFWIGVVILALAVAPMLAGWIVYAQVPDLFSLVGIGMVAVCGAAGAWLTVKERRVPILPAES